MELKVHGDLILADVFTHLSSRKDFPPLSSVKCARHDEFRGDYGKMEEGKDWISLSSSVYDALMSVDVENTSSSGLQMVELDCVCSSH